RVPSQRRVRGRAVDTQRRLHDVGRHVLLKGRDMIRKRTTALIAAVLAALLPGGVARSAPPGKPRAASHPPTAAEFAALKQQVDRQTELIMQLTQLESEHYDYLVKVLNSRPGTPRVALPQTAVTPPTAAGPSGSKEMPPAQAAEAEAPTAT